MATLADFQDNVTDAEKFFSMHKNLKPEEYRIKIIEMYGPPEARDRRMETIVKAAVLAYAMKK